MDSAALPAIVKLSIPGLASLTDSMVSGSIYALVAEAPPARYPLIASSLHSALRQKLPCTVILPGQPDQFIERVNSFAQFDMHQALAEGAIQIFTMQDNFSKSMFRFGAETFCRELDHFQIPDNSYFIFEQADDLLSLHDVALAISQISGLNHWFHEHRVTAMLSFSRIASSATSMAALQCLMDQLGGIARIGGHRDGLEITFDYWHSQDGTVAAKTYPLQTLESGMVAVMPSAAAAGGSVGGANRAAGEEWPEDDQPYFFFMDPDLVSLGKTMPGVWQHVDSLVGMMHATRGTHSSTVILTFKRDTEIRALAQTVHTLRHALGRRSRIVVQEKGASLRYQNEALLLRLGLNLVIHVDVPSSRLPLLLSSLNGQIFDRDVEIDFDQALASVTPSGVRGYVLPERFVGEARNLLERAETLDIPCAMVIGLPTQDMTPADLLSHMLMSRSGDFVTFDQQHCYLFLNSCPDASLLMTLERVLGRGLGVAFVESRFVVRRHEIVAELAAISRAAERFELPDYSALPMRQAPAPRPAAPVASSAAVQAAHRPMPVGAVAPAPLTVSEPARSPFADAAPTEPAIVQAATSAAPLAPALPPESEPEFAHAAPPGPAPELFRRSTPEAAERAPVKRLFGQNNDASANSGVRSFTPLAARPQPAVGSTPPAVFAPVAPEPEAAPIELPVQVATQVAAQAAQLHAAQAAQLQATPPARQPEIEAANEAANEAASETISGSQSGFRYDGELGQVVIFGKKEAPRAMRAAKRV